jgi:hypothetical protein
LLKYAHLHIAFLFIISATLTMYSRKVIVDGWTN